MKNLIKHKEGESSFVTWIKKRMDNNLNFLAIAEGPPGSGKSWSMLKIASELDPEFYTKEQVAFTFKELMQIINKFNEKEDDVPLSLSKKKYKVILFDEVQTSINSRQWQNKVNRLFNYLLTTFRHQNIIVLFTSPYSDFVDSATMKLIHCKFEMKGWDKKTQMSQVRPKLLQYNSKLKKFYEHSLYVIKDGRVNKLTNWHVGRPPQHIVDAYEEMKTAFTNQLNSDITKELEELGKPKEQPEESHPVKPLTELQQKIVDCWERGVLKGKDIALELGKNPSVISESIKFMRNKGVFLEKYKI